MLTGINRTTYKVFVSVSDSKDDEGNPDTEIDATTRVTINRHHNHHHYHPIGRQPWWQQPQPPRYSNPNPDSKPNTNANRTTVLRRDCR